MVGDHQGNGTQVGMKMPARTITLATILFAAAIAAPGSASAQQDYHNRPITLVVPYAAGGGNDVMARIVAEKMSKSLGQQIVIENRGGGGGAVGEGRGRDAAPGGYTLGLGGTGTHAINPTLYPNVGYDPRKDFAPVGLIATSALVVLVNTSVQAKTIPELIALAKRDPGKLNYASPGAGSGIHLGAELFATMAGVKLTHIPYKGSAPALTDLVGGHVAIYFSSLPPAIALIKEGKVRALAVTGPARSPLLPDLPTVAEAALPGYESVLHYGIVAPAGTPRPIVEKLNAAMRAALAEPDVRERIIADGAEPLPGTPEDYAADIDQEETKWSKVVKVSGARVE